MAEWIPWTEGDELPPEGSYFVTAPGLDPEPGALCTFRELVFPGSHQWRYSGVVAYMPSNGGADPKPEPYQPPPTGDPK